MVSERMLNLPRLGRLMSRWQASIGFSYFYVDLLMFIFTLTLTAHLCLLKLKASSFMGFGEVCMHLGGDRGESHATGLEAFFTSRTTLGMGSLAIRLPNRPGRGRRWQSYSWTTSEIGPIGASKGLDAWVSGCRRS